MRDIAEDHTLFLARVYDSLLIQEPVIRTLITEIRTSQDVHLTGFGRSLCIAQAFGIRLFHFREYMKGTISCTSDMIRAPIRKESLLITCSGSGKRQETLCIVQSAKMNGAKIALITYEEKSTIREMADFVITIPRDGSLFYGAGDFELGAFICFEMIITLMGQILNIPEDVVTKWHV